MITIDNLIKEKQLLVAQYSVLIEDAYNYMENDNELSDIFEYEATQVMHRITQLDTKLSLSLV
ncbi:Lacal_2735 family protein [Psychroserpens sp.]|uniref:Lacal_2735 family protein n=1 Tax=Psychroserpens sp. TaxID=2020870 RepID=UPI002AA798FF|nr:Lacal_2735 family protein [Psychroserpens sp.]